MLVHQHKFSALNRRYFKKDRKYICDSLLWGENDIFFFSNGKKRPFNQRIFMIFFYFRFFFFRNNTKQIFMQCVIFILVIFICILLIVFTFSTSSFQLIQQRFSSKCKKISLTTVHQPQASILKDYRRILVESVDLETV